MYQRQAYEQLVSGLPLWWELYSINEVLLRLWSGHVHSTPDVIATTTSGCYGEVGCPAFPSVSTNCLQWINTSPCIYLCGRRIQCRMTPCLLVAAQSLKQMLPLDEMNTSSHPSSGVMNPKPLPVNHISTEPVCVMARPTERTAVTSTMSS